MSVLTSDGFLRFRKCAAIPRDGPLDQAGGGSGIDGAGGVNDGKVMGTGREGGGLSLSQSCWPARSVSAWVSYMSDDNSRARSATDQMKRVWSLEPWRGCNEGAKHAKSTRNVDFDARKGGFQAEAVRAKVRM